MSRSANCAVMSPYARKRAIRPAAASLVAIDALAPLVPLLRLDRERGDRARLEPLERDRLAGLLAIAVGAVVETGSAASILAISLRWRSRARSSIARSVSEEARSARSGWFSFSACRWAKRLLGLLQDVVLPGEQLLAEILPLALIHEWLFVGRSVGLVPDKAAYAVLIPKTLQPRARTDANPLLAGRAYIGPPRNRTITEL